MARPTLSFVVTARNDDYGGNLLNRTTTFVRILSFLADTHHIPIEIVIVEYNPVPDTAYLFQEIPAPTTPFVTITGIVVPKEFHDKIRKNNIPLLEYIGKNIGIRRAKGEYIVATNPDIVFSEELFTAMTADTLNPAAFYRADRYELATDYFPESMPPAKVLNFCKKDVIKILYSPRTHYTSWKHWIKRVPHGWRNLLLCPLFNPFYPPDRASIYENASGDFTMAHRTLWERARGYDQSPHNLHHDSLMLHVFRALGYTQYIFAGPLYHIHHLEGRAGRPGIEFAAYREITKNMQETGIPLITNDEHWGFSAEPFAEIPVTPEKTAAQMS